MERSVAPQTPWFNSGVQPRVRSDSPYKEPCVEHRGVAQARTLRAGAFRCAQVAMGVSQTGGHDQLLKPLLQYVHDVGFGAIRFGGRLSPRASGAIGVGRSKYRLSYCIAS